MAPKVALEEKRTRMLNIIRSSNTFFNLKELEKLGAKAGVIQQTIKDVLDGLVSDNLVQSEKVGASNYFFSFESQNLITAQNQNQALEIQLEALKQSLPAINEQIQAHQNDRQETDERQDLMMRLEKERERNRVLEMNLKEFGSMDASKLELVQKETKLLKDGSNRWTDNLFTLMNWMKNDMGIGSDQIETSFRVPQDFDYEF